VILRRAIFYLLQDEPFSLRENMNIFMSRRLLVMLR
jgi:hypothetical protein